jgi:5-formyltetrahydrofolate cyclo-ligase
MVPPNDMTREETTVAEAKHAARAQAREARNAVTPSERQSAVQQLSSVLLAVPELAEASTVLVHAALPSEIDPTPAIWSLRKRGVRIVYPRIEAPGVLGLHYVDHELDLVPGPFGLSQPSEHAPRTPHALIDAILVPAVAFDEQGSRLGYGGGYYDRLLPQCRPACIRIGIAFDEQVLGHIPAEEHDQRVDAIITPTRIIRPDTPRRF